MTSLTEGTLLGGRVRYRQFATGHRSGFEPVLLAAAVPAQPRDLVLELGTGAGAALLCLATRVPGVAGVGVEIDPALATLADENFRINGLKEVYAVEADAGQLPFGRIFDHAMANPPWHDAAGTISPDRKRALAHHAGPGLLAAWIGTMAGAVKRGGSITLIIPANAVSGAIAALEAANYPAVTVFPLLPRAGRQAKQVILQARQDGKPCTLPGLILHDATGIAAPAEDVLRHGGSLDFHDRSTASRIIAAIPSATAATKAQAPNPAGKP